MPKVNMKSKFRRENGVTVTIKAKSFEAPYYKINSNSGSGTTQNSVIAKDAVYSSPEIILSDIKLMILSPQERQHITMRN